MSKSRLLASLGALLITTLMVGLGSSLGETGRASLSSEDEQTTEAPGVDSVNPNNSYVYPGFGSVYPQYPPYAEIVRSAGSREKSVPFGSRFRMYNDFGDGLGYMEGYSSFSAFVPLEFNSSNDLIFLDARGYLTHSTDGGIGDSTGGNIGVGGRHYFAELNRFFGISAWFDVDGGHESSFTQGGVSFESVGKYVDFRVNGYFPIGDTSEEVFNAFVSDPFFRGHEIHFLNRNITEYQFSGVDAEIGGPVPFLRNEGVSAFFGGYFLNADGRDDAIGYQARIQANINEDLQAGVRITTDNIFGTSTWATLAFSFPRTSFHNWFERKLFKPASVHERMDRQVERNYRIAVESVTKDTEVAAINPADSMPILVDHIDPEAATNGDGTVETPFNSIAGFVNTASTDIIRVLPGNSSNLVSSGPIALFNNQRLLSSTVDHTFTATQGTFTLPGFTGGTSPMLTNSSGTMGSVVQLANNNEVSGFAIDGTGGGVLHNGIQSQAGGITSFNINRNTFTSILDGVRITSSGTGTGIISGNTATGAGAGSGSGYSVTANSASTLGLTIASNTATNFLGEDNNLNGVLDFGEDANLDGLLTPGIGIELVSTAGATINATVSGNSATANGTGMTMTANGGGVINATVSGNDFSNNVNPNTGLHITADAGTVTSTLASNTINNNAGSQLAIDALNAGTATTTLTGNSFDRTIAGVNGIKVDARSGSTATVTGSGNSVVGGAATSREGLLATIVDSTFNLTLSSPTLAGGNIFDENRGAAIAIDLSGASTSTIDLQKNTITDTRDDADVLTSYAGSGIDITVAGTSTLQNSTIDGNIVGSTGNGNEGVGISALVTDTATISNLTIGNTNGDNADGNLVQANAAGGIFMRRELDATLNTVNIEDNTVEGNTGHGVQLQAQGTTNDAADFNVEDNVIANNTIDGVHLRAEADATLDVDLNDNLITNNTGDGVETTDQANAPTDARNVTGVWQENIITNNEGHGIAINGAISGLQVGLADAGGIFRGNLIDVNGLDGIEINGPGSGTFTNNWITRNGNLALANPLQGGGVDIQGAGTKNLTFTSNVITENLGDGFELLNNQEFAFTIALNSNTISMNTGRGIDILNQGDSVTSFTANLNTINLNSGEGVYVVNTASTTQDQSSATPDVDPDTDASHGMNADGAVIADPRLLLSFTNNTVLGNGSGTAFDGTGLVIRVGTAGGGSSDFTATGGFASDGAGTQINAGVLATVTGNTLGGNFGEDVWIESFTSTVDPATTAGTFDNTPTLTVTTFETDPLARLDLTYSGNTTDTVDVNNVGAFYDNAEPVFKSRNDAQTDPGPFSSVVERARNAQRLAFRGTLAPAHGATFLYPGMGESTFRLSAGSDLGDFLVDTQAWADETDNNGVTSVPIIGEEPWGWSIFP